MIPLYLFAKAPEPGAVKTRLQPHIGAYACAALARAMLFESARKVRRHWPGRLVLCVSPDIDAPEFQELSRRLDCDLIPQLDAGLGERMLGALGQGIAEAGSAAVMGCDVPHIAAEILVEAGEHLAAGRNIIGPAADGGFYLFGMGRLVPELFEEVEWGSARVFKNVMSNAAESGITFTALETLRDIDVIEDLRWLAGQDEKYRRFLGHHDRTES